MYACIYIISVSSSCLELYLPKKITINGHFRVLIISCIMQDFIPESIESVAELMTPPSPDSSYGFHVPGEKELAKEPPQLPAQLYLGVLNARRSSGGARPRHVVLDHLYIEKGWGAQPLVALGYTHRFRSKYVTCVLYKAIQRSVLDNHGRQMQLHPQSRQ
jgi:hypothetical protein